MRSCFLSCVILSLAACAGLSGPHPSEVQRNIRYAVIFGFTTNPDGYLDALRVAAVTDVLQRNPDGTPKMVDFVPSDAFVASARAALSNGRWRQLRNADGTAREGFQFCYYSTVIPDQAICADEFSKPNR